MTHSRDRLLLTAAITILLAVGVCTAGAVRWVGAPFPGFLVLENRVVASAGLAHWPATEGGRIYQHEIVAVDGRPLEDVHELHALVASQRPGTEIRYRFRRGQQEFERVIPTRLFRWIDFNLLFGSLLLNGLAFGGTGLLIRFLRGGDRMATGSLPILWLGGIWGLTAMDLYGPYHLFRVHAFCETLLFACTLHMALVFPLPSRFLLRHPRVLHAVYGAALVLALVNQVGLYTPHVYVTTHLAAVSFFGASLVFFIAVNVRGFLRPPSFEARQRIKVVAFGTVAALTPPMLLALGGTLTGGGTPQNAMAFSCFLFPLSIGYAVVRHNLLEVDVFVQRSLSYALLTAVVMVIYLGAVQVIGVAFGTSGPVDASGVVATALCVVLLMPLRHRAQNVIDRLFFRSSYDFRLIVESASARLAQASSLAEVAGEVLRAAGETLHPERLTLYVRLREGSELEPFLGRPAPEVEARDRADIAVSRAEPSETGERGLCVPFRTENDLVGVLILGRRRSGSIYGGDDRRLLHTLANQGAVAIENALALERLRELASELEAKVEERTSELRKANAQLVHREKMASIGQFVAGIAHELNNPLNFIQGNLHCLREYVGTMAQALASYEAAVRDQQGVAERLAAIRRDSELDEVLADLESAFEGCGEGIERSTILVRDLRSFSRLDDTRRAVAEDLHQSLDSALNLLRSKLTGIGVVREYGEVPEVDALPGQLGQVFINLIANAADAGCRNITLRTHRIDEGSVQIEIEDDGDGIPEAQLERIFDPFFTTKEVGKGTGLGLSISYGVVARHKGSITVESEVGRGTCFRIALPVAAARPGGAEGPDAQAGGPA